MSRSFFRAALFAIFFGCFLTAFASAQEKSRLSSIGFKLQAYPAGLISAATYSTGLTEKDALNFFVAYNATNRRGFGKHDNEEGGGAGFGAGWRRYLGENYSGFHFGARVDFWFLDIDWRNDSPSDAGKTEITVLQPTAQAGYTKLFSDNRIAAYGGVAFGAEINIKTKGEAVGESAIFLLGAGVRYRF